MAYLFLVLFFISLIGLIIGLKNPLLRIHSAFMDGMFYGTEHLVQKLTYSTDMKTAEWVYDFISQGRAKEYEMRKLHNNKLYEKQLELFGKERSDKGLKLRLKEATIGKIKGEEDLKRWRFLETRKLYAKENEIFSKKALDGKTLEVKLSQGEAGYFWGQLRDPSQRQNVLNSFTDKVMFSKDAEKDAMIKEKVQAEIEKKINEYTTPEMKEFIDYMQFEWFRGIAEDGVEQRFIEKFGIDMPLNPFFIPKEAEGTTIKEVTNLFLGEAFPAFASTIPGGVKERAKGTLFRKADIFQVANKHLVQMSQFAHMDRVVSGLRSVFTDKRVVDAVKASGNKSTHSTLLKRIDDMARSGRVADY
jgi:hypothetical protein